MISDRAKILGWSVCRKQRFEAANGVAKCPPLLVFKNDEALVVDPCVTYEVDKDFLKRANNKKLETYVPFSQVIQQILGVKKVTVRGLAVGARGGWCKKNDKTLALIGIRDKRFNKHLPANCKKFRKFKN